MKATGIGKRVEKAIMEFKSEDYEDTLYQLFSAIDKTAKKRRPDLGVGERIREFIREEVKYITGLTTSSSIGNLISDNKDLADALYKLARTYLFHECELSTKLSINKGQKIVFGQNEWSLPSFIILGLIFVVIIAPENKEEISNHDFDINILGNDYSLSELWGRKDIMRKMLNERFNSDNF